MPRLQHHLVTTPDGTRLAAYVHEPAGPASATVVLAHGWILDHRSWERVVDRLPADLRIVLWDQRGHGRSTLRGGRMRAGGETVRQLGDDLNHVVDALVPSDSPLVLCGHSMGGMTVMAYAGRAPALSPRIRGVVLVSTASDDLRGLGLPGERMLMQLATRLPLRLGRFVPARALRTVFGRHPRPEDVSATRDQLGGTRLSTIATFYFALMDHDESAALRVLASVPVSILVGTKDRLTPRRYAQQLADRVPGSSLVELPERGHMLPYEDPDTIVAAIAAALRGRTLGETTDPELERPFAS